MVKSAAILAAVFGVLLAVATATATTLKVEVDEEENPSRMRGSCWDQMERADMLSECQNFLMEVSQSGSMQCGGGVRRHDTGRGMRKSYHFDACCDQLSMIGEQCMCEGMKQMMMEEQERFHGRESQKMMHCAKELPRMCGMGRTCYQIRERGSISI